MTSKHVCALMRGKKLLVTENINKMESSPPMTSCGTYNIQQNSNCNAPYCLPNSLNVTAPRYLLNDPTYSALYTQLYNGILNNNFEVAF